MSDDDAFMKAILENPDEDAPRLAYADWLDEDGDVRASFIRVQVELARTPQPADGNPDGVGCLYEPPCPYHALKRRELAMSVAYCTGWVVADGGTPYLGQPKYVRGFIEEIDNAHMGNWPSAAAALLAAMPLRKVTTATLGAGPLVWTIRRLPGAAYAQWRVEVTDGTFKANNGYWRRDEMVRRAARDIPEMARRLAQSATGRFVHAGASDTPEVDCRRAVDAALADMGRLEREHRRRLMESPVVRGPVDD